MKRVYQAISEVAADMSRYGIGKRQQNKAQGFRFRGIDDVYNALSGSLVAHGLVMLPRVLSRSISERQGRSGGAIFSVAVEVAYDLIAVEDASTHTVVIVGEAMDAGDKATSKALSMAYKYAALQTFCIPIEGEPDADAESWQVKGQPGGEQESTDRASFERAMAEAEYHMRSTK